MTTIKPKKIFHRRGVVEDYPLAKDKREIWRLNLQHRLFKKALHNRNFCAPIRDPQAILDVGCGTGIWPLEVARRFRQAQQVLGIDKHLELTEVLLRVENGEEAEIPASLSFEKMDALEPLPFESNHFDFVHGRFIASFVKREKWPVLIAEMIRVTRPGGWIEIAEAELSTNDGPLLQEVNQALLRLASVLDLLVAGGEVVGWLRNADLRKVQSRRVQLQGKDLPKNVSEAMHSFAPALLKTEVIARDRLDAILAGFEEEARQYGIKVPVVVAWGQKS